MKDLIVITLLLDLLIDVSAISCKSQLTFDCLGKTDVRYNSYSTVHLEELNSLWQSYEGFWVGSYTLLDEDGFPLESTFYNPETKQGFPYNVGTTQKFINNTIQRSRFHQHIYNIYSPGSPTFCSQPIPANLTNVITGGNKGGLCGETGYFTYTERFGTSTHEKDGVAKIFWLSGTDIMVFGHGSSGADKVVMEVTPVGDSSITTSSKNFVETMTFLDPNHKESLGTGVVEDDESASSSSYLPYSSSSFRYIAWWTKVDESDWIDAIEESFFESNVLEEDRLSIPMQNSCLGSICPKETDWCEHDPQCSQSPYQEPRGRFKPGVIVGLSLMSAAILIAAILCWHFTRMKQQEKRYKEMFVRRVVRSVDIRASTGQLSPEDLANEFKRIDNGLRDGRDGYISKEELWTFFSDAKAGEISESDFNALFAAMDVHSQGKVNFTEFCAFLSSCGEQLEDVRMEKKKMLFDDDHSPEKELEVAARRLSSMRLSMVSEKNRSRNSGVTERERKPILEEALAIT